MAGEEEADGVELLLQPLGRQPGLDIAERKRRRAAPPPNSSDCPTATSSCVRCAVASIGVDGREHARAIAFERIEGAGGGEALQHALVDRARIDAAGEIGQIGERPLAARLDDRLDRLAADALERRERVVDGVALDLEVRRRSG